MTIDTTPPPAPIIVGLAGGTATSGNSATTDAKNPILFGTAAPYSQVTLYYGTYPVGSVVADSNGDWNWTNTAGTPTVGTTYSITARATDVAGNVSSLSAAYSVTRGPTVRAGTARNRLQCEPLHRQHPQYQRRRIFRYHRHADDHWRRDGELPGSGVR